MTLKRGMRRNDGYELSDDKSRLDLDMVHMFLRNAYWCKGLPSAVLKRGIEGSWCFGLYAPSQEQVGFSRLITDYATYAYLADVFVVEALRGSGLGGWMMEQIFSQSDIKGLRRITLATRDAHRFYKKVGFAPLAQPEIFMEIVRSDIYDETKSIG